MTTALRLLCEWLFNELNLGRIALITSPANAASQRVAQRVGFCEEGLLRAYLLDHETGKRRDSQIWSLLPTDLTIRSPK